MSGQVAGASTGYQFTHNLQLGDSGEDVTQLQTFLRAQGADIYPEGLITGYFGNLTKLAVQRFQEKYNIAKSGDAGYGYVGPKTRAKINSL
jgi:peptidoglycan hydrolase-like protein with peptidoglycan-binding domain